MSKIFRENKNNFFLTQKNIAISLKKCIIYRKRNAGAFPLREGARRAFRAEQPMNEDFIKDLDEYFAKKYVNFDLISAMPSYESVTISMVLKNVNRITEGEYSVNEMRKIAYQPQADKVLAEVKERYVDNNFTFSVRVAPFRAHIRALFSAKSAAGHKVKEIVAKYGEDPAALASRLGIDEKLWKATLRGWYIPEKVLVFKLALLLGMRGEDITALMRACECSYNFEDARDVVVKYLFDYRIFNEEMIGRAFDEYHIRRIL